MRDFTQEELRQLLYENQYNNSYSKYNSEEYIGKEKKGIKILGFVSTNKEIIYSTYLLMSRIYD